MKFRLHNQKDKKRKREASQLKNKRTRKKEKRQILESLLQLDHIPREIIENILSKLPAKSLLLFKSVCKSWLSTISDPNFYKRYQRNSVFAVVGTFHGPLLYLIDEKANTEHFQVPWDTKYLRSAVQVESSNSCNGMVLIYLGYGITIGLCYDEFIGDYKAILIQLLDLRFSPYVIVATLKGNKWDQVRLPFDLSYVSAGPVVKGRLHWVVSESNDGDYFHAGNVIIRFNPLLNVFEAFPTPLPKPGYENAIVGLGVLEGFLCMARRDNKNDFEGDVEILAMKEYGVVESWTTMFVLSNLEIDRYDWNLTPMLMTKDGEVLLSTSNEIWVYNLAKKTYTKCNIRKGWNTNATSLVENLVSPIGY